MLSVQTAAPLAVQLRRRHVIPCNSSSTTKSNVYQHFMESHNLCPTAENISVIIKKRGFSNTLYRQAAEAELITHEQPRINVQLTYTEH